MTWYDGPPQVDRVKPIGGRMRPMSLEQDLRTHLESFHTAPFLFIGSGMSRRYLGLEDWEGLLRRLAALTGRPYEYFRSSGDGSYPAIAGEIARELHPLWWNTDTFADSKAKYLHEANSRESALKIEISKYLETISEPQVAETPSLLDELEALRQATIDGIITTNWDLFLENIFPDLTVYIGQDELLFSATHGVGEIYKIHGCCSKPNSLVATAADYARFSERNAYLAAKLLTVFAEHPVIFLGYSLNDANVTGILQSIAACLTTKNIDQLRDRLILVRWDPGAGVHGWEDSVIVAHNYSIPVKTATTDSFLPIYNCLATLPRKFPARILRRLKEHVYELVHDNDPSDRLYVANIDDDVDPSQIKVVYGVGLRVEDRRIRLSTASDADPVRLSTDPEAPVIPYSALDLEGSTYSNLQQELEAFVRAWRSDAFAYIPRSRLDMFYAHRLELEPDDDQLRCLLVSAMHHQATPVHYWAVKLGRPSLLPLLRDEIKLDMYPRIRRAARLAFAAGMTDGEKMLKEIATKSKYIAVRTLAARLLVRLEKESIIHPAYRSPMRSTHVIDGQEVVVDIGEVFQDPEQTERVLSYLAGEGDTKSRTRLKQLDAYFYGTKL